MIHGFPRPTLSDAIEVDSLTKIVRTLNDFPAEVIKQIDGRRVVLFTDGEQVVLVYTSGYDYPRYKSPRIAYNAYEGMGDYALERLLKCKVNGDEVDFVIGGEQAVTK
jgi:hypothetical protein